MSELVKHLIASPFLPWAIVAAMAVLAAVLLPLYLRARAEDDARVAKLAAEVVPLPGLRLPPTPRPAPAHFARKRESTRRWLYDEVLRIIREDREQEEPPRPVLPFDPDLAGLSITWFAGRWFATWADLEAPPALPESVRFPIVRLQLADDGEVVLHEV